MIYSEDRGCIVDYLGTHQHLAVDITLSVAANGGLRLRSGEQRFYEGPVAFLSYSPESLKSASGSTTSTDVFASR